MLTSTQGPLTLPVTQVKFDVDFVCDMGSICALFKRTIKAPKPDC